MLHQHNLSAPACEPIAPKHQAWWEALEESLPPSERLRAQQDRALVAYLATLIHTVEAELARVSQQAAWRDQVPFLIQLPGIGLIGAMTVLAAIGDITRFATALASGGLRGPGSTDPCLRASASFWQYHQDWPFGFADHPGRSRLDNYPHFRVAARPL